MNNLDKYLNVCCEKGILLRFNKKTNFWSKFYIGNSKNISQYLKIRNEHYLFCENEFIIFNELKTDVKEFESNIVSILRKAQKISSCYISLENGEIWRYDLTNRTFVQLFSFHSKIKACVNLQTNFSFILSKDRKVFTVYNKSIQRIPELNGCEDIIASRGAIVVCYFGYGVCKIYEMANKKIFNLKISESIKFAKHSESILSLLDARNRLHLYQFKRKTFRYEEFQVIQIPTSENISAISEVINNKIFINVKNKIYLIKYN